MQVECDCHDLRWSRCTASWFRRECLGLNNNCAAALRLLGRKQRKSSCLGWKITISNKRGQSHTTPGLAAFHLNSIFDCNEVTKMYNFLDAIASPSTYPCQWVSGSLIVSDWRLLSHLRALWACWIGNPKVIPFGVVRPNRSSASPYKYWEKFVCLMPNAV